MLDQYAAPIRVPQLAIRDGQQMLRFDPIELDEFAWNLNKCDPKFSAGEFSDDLHIGDRVLVDVTSQGAVRVGGVQEVIVRQQSLAFMDEPGDKADMVRWLDRELHRGGRNAGLRAAESQAWLNRVLDSLVTERGIAVAGIDRRRHELADLIDKRISEHGRKQFGTRRSHSSQAKADGGW